MKCKRLTISAQKHEPKHELIKAQNMNNYARKCECEHEGHKMSKYVRSNRKSFEKKPDK